MNIKKLHWRNDGRLEGIAAAYLYDEVCLGRPSCSIQRGPKSACPITHTPDQKVVPSQIYRVYTRDVKNLPGKRVMCSAIHPIYTTRKPYYYQLLDRGINLFITWWFRLSQKIFHSFSWLQKKMGTFFLLLLFWKPSKQLWNELEKIYFYGKMQIRLFIYTIWKKKSNRGKLNHKKLISTFGCIKKI